MKKKALLVFGLAIMMILAMSLSVYAVDDLDSFPAEIDPQDWTTNEDVTWDAWEDNPVIDWTDLDLPDAQLQKGVLLMCDFTDLPFIMTQPKGSDFMGNPQVDPIAPEEVGEFWKELLNVPSELNDYTSIDGFWRENSYGKWKVEIEAFGPYHLEGMEWEYGIDSKVGAYGTKRSIINETLAAFLADDSHDYTLGDFTFGFIVHAGYTESAVWQEAGEMMFDSKEDITEFYGPTVEELEAMKAWGAKPHGTNEPILNSRGAVTNDISWAEHLYDGVAADGEFLVIDAKQGANWAGTKYVDWTSWKAAKTVWSHTSSYTGQGEEIDGLAKGTRWRISVQSEDNGMGTYAHEFGHITGISDNYNNAYAVPYQRTYGGYWELMSAGNQNGPGGTHSRYTIPARKGDVIPAEHTVRLKLKQGFYDEGQYTRFGQESLIENGPVFETIVARNVPTTGEFGVGYGYNGLMMDLTQDKTPIVATSDPAYDWMNVGTFGSFRGEYTPEKGYYQFYGMEVIQTTGYESFLPDEGVLITMNREVDNERAPFIWVIDSHPEDINLVNFTMPGTGEEIMVTPGDSRQLYDALFHAGTGDDVVSEYVDEYNQLHFYVLEKNYDKQGVLSYRVAVRSDEFTGEYNDAMSVKVGEVSPAEAGKVAVQEIEITNNGTKTGLYRLSATNERGWASMLSVEVIEVEAGETVTVPMYVQVPETRAHANDFTFTVTSEVTGKKATAEGTITPPAAELVYNTYEGATESVAPEFTGKDVKEIPVIDPQDWQVSEEMDWSEWKDNPWIDWTELSYKDMPGVDVKRGLLLMCDFADLDFIMTQPKGSDFMGNPTVEPITRDEVGEYWTTLLNVPCELNDYTSIDGFWRENSYGKWAVEIEAYGPYRLEGMEWEYGLDDMNGGTGKRSIIDEVIAAYTADTTPGKPMMKDFDFGFIVHAGYTESAVWQEAGEMMFADKESVPEFYGPTVEELQAIKAWGAKPHGLAEEEKVTMQWGNFVYSYVANDISGWSMFFDGVDPVTGEFLIVDGKQGGNWAPTRYIPWTSFKAAKSVWSFTSSYTAKEGDNTGLEPGTRWRISCQSEDNGMGTYAHEFGHISGISDNYVSAYTTPAQRTPAGNWELMNAGNQNGPGGTHGRYTIPARLGDVIPSEHTVRLKVKQGFYDEGQASIVDQPSLQQYGPVFETIVARNVPTTGKYGVGYGVNGMIIDLVEDKTPIIPTSSPDYVWNNVATYGSGVAATGYYQNYGIEVIQKTGYESFMHDEGVLISMYRDRESAPFIWVIDSHPEDINIVNFKHPGTGEDVYITKGENRQLNDALFHAGTGEDVVSEYYDEYNKLHFYVLDKMYDEAGVLSYRVAVLSKEFTGEYDDEVAVDLGDASPAKAGNVASQEITITNLGSQPALYRLSSTNEEGWDWAVVNEVIEVAPGEEVSIPLYFEVPDFRPADNDFDFTVTSEVTGESFTVSGTIEPLNGEGVVRPSDDEDDEDEDTEAPEIVEPVSELPFVDVAVDAWFYNDVLVAWKDGLVNGRTETTYVPDGNITIAEAIKLASTMHQKYTAGAVTLTNGAEAWYSTYVEYAVANGIIKDGEYTDMNAIATRAQFASIFAAALPAEALTAINAVEDGKIPDVKMADSYGAAVYKLYNAGILTGNDAVGTFAPMSNIKRSEVAAIVNRMMHAENRKTVAL